MTYLRDTAALARKDLLIELRGRETLPAMLLFVVATHDPEPLLPLATARLALT